MAEKLVQPFLIWHLNTKENAIDFLRLSVDWSDYVNRKQQIETKYGGRFPKTWAQEALEIETNLLNKK